MEKTHRFVCFFNFFLLAENIELKNRYTHIEYEKELAQKLNVSEKTIKRDIADLKQKIFDFYVKICKNIE